jgi:hypothetical protein
MTSQRKYLYHGSHKLIKNILNPHPSKVVNGEEKVFATPSKAFALMFLGKRWHDDDIELGSHGEKHLLYAIEKKKNIFIKIFSGKTGYLYKVNAKQFHTDERLGMKNYEYIADQPVDILSTKIINDVYKELLKSDIRMITFDKIKFIYFNQIKYNSDVVIVDIFNYEKLDDIMANIKLYKKKNVVVNGAIDYGNIWKSIYNLDKNVTITKIGLVEIKKNDYTFVVYDK